MSNTRGNKALRMFFLVSLGVHGLLLGMPESFIHFSTRHVPEKEEVVVEINIEKPVILPRVDVMGEEKKIKKIKEEQIPPEPAMEKAVEKDETKKRPEEEPETVIVEEMPVEEWKKESSQKEQIEVLDPEDETMFRYQDMIKQRIQSCRKYPRRAKKRRIEGVTCLIFTVVSDGSVRDIKVVQSSGSDVLDKEAVAIVARAAPFPPIPGKFDRSYLTMEVDVVFMLQ
ncbi:MAG: energy transducer TonB [Candidatus Omnitrophota bacterium]|nr:energy transducer TonB [Candidatus Omnitrophota bacterium]